MSRAILISIVLVAILIASYFQGWLKLVHEGDSTHIVWGQGILFLVGIVFTWFGKWKTVNWVADALLFIGLIGTVIGFIIALSGIDPSVASDIEQVKPMVANLLTGMGTALYTTLVGAVCCLCLKFIQHVCKIK